MAMTLSELRRAPRSAPKLCGCGCGEPLEPRIDGVRQTIGGAEVNADCYFDRLSDLIEHAPPRRIGRRA